MMSGQVDNAAVDEEVGVEEAPATPAPKTMEVAGVTLTEAQVPLTIVLLSSIVLLIAVGAEYDWVSRRGNALSVCQRCRIKTLTPNQCLYSIS